MGSLDARSRRLSASEMPVNNFSAKCKALVCCIWFITCLQKQFECHFVNRYFALSKMLPMFHQPNPYHTEKVDGFETISIQ